MAAADIYDAVTTDRPYQKGMSNPEAKAILQKQAGDKLSPRWWRPLSPR